MRRQTTDRRLAKPLFRLNSMAQDDRTVKKTVEARQGETSGHVRWVLGISLFPAIVVLGGLNLFFPHGR